MCHVGLVVAFAWGDAVGMKFLRRLRGAATLPFPEAAELDEGRRFPICNPGSLDALFTA